MTVGPIPDNCYTGPRLVDTPEYAQGWNDAVRSTTIREKQLRDEIERLRTRIQDEVDRNEKRVQTLI